MYIIYRESDLSLVGTVCSNMTVQQEIELNVIPNFGGVSTDYASIETSETNFHLENVNGVVTVVANPTPVPTPQLPTEADYLLDLDFRLSRIELGL